MVLLGPHLGPRTCVCTNKNINLSRQKPINISFNLVLRALYTYDPHVLELGLYYFHKHLCMES